MHTELKEIASILRVKRRRGVQTKRIPAPTIRMLVSPSFRYKSNRELIERCLNHDSRAWYELIRRYGSAMYAAIIMELESGAPSEDGADAERILGIVMDTLLDRDCAILRNLVDPESSRIYLCHTACAVTMEYIEQKLLSPTRTHTKESSRATGHCTVSGTIKDECRKLARALEKLSVRHQFFLKLYYEQGLACSEIAELTNAPVETVGAILGRAREIARGLLTRRRRRPWGR